MDKVLKPSDFKFKVHAQHKMSHGNQIIWNESHKLERMTFLCIRTSVDMPGKDYNCFKIGCKEWGV
jgi:hypothetical protein